jgi:hypothetical protein
MMPSPYYGFDASREAHDQGWRSAAAMFEYLRRGGHAASVTVPDVLMFPGEACYADFPLEYSRYYGTDVYYQQSFYVAGSLPFMAAGLAASLAANAAKRARAAREAASQWRDVCISRVITTSTRIICCHPNGQWMEFGYHAVVQLLPDPMSFSFTVAFVDTAPLRLRGPAAVWLAVLLVWLRQGPQGLTDHPAFAMFSAGRLNPQEDPASRPALPPPADPDFA